MKSKLMKGILAITMVLAFFSFAANDASKAVASQGNLYIYDLNDYLQNDTRCYFTGSDGKRYITPYGYDFLKMAAVFQGLVNRSSTGDKIYYIYEASSEIAKPRNFHPDYFWLDKLDDPGKYLAGYTKINVATDRFYQDLFSIFKSKVKGIVLWSDAIPATSNVASTVSGVDKYLPARKGGALYTELKAQLGTVHELDLDAKFSGSYSTIPDTKLATTGSKKNDVYLWAKVKYIDTDKVTPTLVEYAVDAYTTLKDSNGNPYYEDNLFNRMLINADYYISNKAFFVDLSPLSNVKPNDDKNQTLGTDTNTLRTILAALRSKAGTSIITVGGFPQWQNKYSSFADSTQPHPIYSEWGLVDLVSEYYAQLDSDAPGLMGLANASIYQFVPLNATLKQNNNKGVNNGITYDPSKRYIAFYMGDYDAGAWTAGELPALWNNPGRGKMPLGWSVVPNLSKRIPQLYNYIYETATSNDYFISGDNGAGYLNAIKLPSQYISHWKTYNQTLFDRFDLDIAGFVITDFEPKLPDWLQRHYTDFATAGVGVNSGPESEFVRGVPFHHVKDMKNGHTPKDATAVKNGLYSELTSDMSRKFWFFRTILTDPDRLVDGVNQLKASNPELNIEVVDPYTWYRLYKESKGAIAKINIEGAEFLANGSGGEAGYIHTDDSYGIDGNHRFADLTGSWSYKFDLHDATAKATTYLDIASEYVVQGSTDGVNWTQLAKASGREARSVISLNLDSLLTSNPSKTIYLRFSDGTPEDGYGPSLWSVKLITDRFVTSFEPGELQPTWLDSPERKHNVTGYLAGINPECSPRSGEEYFGGNSSIMCAGTDNSTTQSFIYFQVFDVNIPVESTTKLNYQFFPTTENSRYVAVDFIMTDGTTLRDSGAVDQNRVLMHPAIPKGTVGTWTKIESDVGAKLNGKIIDKILIGYDQGPNTGQFRAYIDNIAISQ